MGNGWKEVTDETKNAPFWICWHAGMLFLHGVITIETFNSIYNRYKNE